MKARRRKEVTRGEQDLVASVIDTAGILIVVFSAGARVERINHLFTQLTGMTLERVNERQYGTGLGLAVAHQHIKANGGAMSVESTVGRGTTFHIFLPSIEPA